MWLFHQKKVQSILWVILLLSIWQIISILGLLPAYFLPRFSDVLITLLQELFSGKLTLQVLNSIWMVLFGFLVSFVIVVIMVILSMWLKAFRNLFSTLVTIFNPLPSMALMPLIILWFGINTTGILVLIAHGVVWSMYRHIKDGISSIPKVYNEFADNIELSVFQRILGIVVFAIMPELVASLRIAWGRSWRALISAEIAFGAIGNLGGVGFYISMGRVYGKMERVMAGVLVIAVIGILMESLVFNQIEMHTIKKWGMTNDV
jgi:NitT/TauT family transport system permease protein